MRRLNAVVPALLLGAVILVSPVSGQDKKPTKAKRSPAELAAIASIKKMGGHVMEIAQNDARLEVAYHLADGKVTDKHLVPLKGLKNVVQLNLRGTDITDAGLANIAGLTSLKKLHLEKTKISDKGLTHLKGLQNLESLNIYGTTVTDAGLQQLAALKKLKKVYIWQSKVTIDGVAKMKKAMPKLAIIPDLVVEKAKAEARAKAEAAAKKKAAEEAKKKAKKTGKKKPKKKKSKKKK